ncbi:MAG: cytidylyltransferase [Chloroflexi bacterium]|nr:cytidylyltransferase [Chloroflexota bacterium]
MIAGLLIGKHLSMGCPGKNVRPILGRPMTEYGFIAAKHSRCVQRMFVSTDSPHIAEIGRQYGAEHIERPPELATPDALTEDALVHAYREMVRRAGQHIDIVALFFANAPTIPPGLVDKGIEVLLDDSSLDSAFSVTKYNMWSPVRARRLDSGNLIQPYVDLDLLGGPERLSSIRGAEGDCYFVDLAVQVLRDRCFLEMDEGHLPFKWMGKRSHALISDYGFDIDYEWQIPVIEQWLREHGFTETATPYDGEKQAL